MSPKKDSIRTAACDRTDAAARLAQAKKFLEQAEVVATDTHSPASADGAASLAVLAGIAACDAACCATIGRRSRSQNHADAALLVREITPGGKNAANALARLLSMKDKANYGIENISSTQLSSAIKQASALVAFAEDLMRR